MEFVDPAERTEPDQTAAQILVITCSEHAAAVLAEPPDGICFRGGEPITGVDRHQPQLIEAGCVEPAQDGVLVDVVGPIPGGHIVACGAQLIGQQ